MPPDYIEKSLNKYTVTMSVWRQNDARFRIEPTVIFISLHLGIYIFERRRKEKRTHKNTINDRVFVLPFHIEINEKI